MSLDSEAGLKEMSEFDERNDWTFLEEQKDVSQVEDMHDNSSENADEEEDDLETGDLCP